eukprot:g2761.t1
MPLLNLRLTNTDGSNRCVVDLPHEIRTQDMRVKQTRVHYNHEDHSTTVGNYSVHNADIQFAGTGSTALMAINLTSALAEFFTGCVTGDMIEYTSAVADNQLLLRPGFYFVERTPAAGTAGATTVQFAFHSSRARAMDHNGAARVAMNAHADTDHDHHQFRLVQRIAGSDRQRVPPTLKTVNADFKFFSGYEVTSNVSGGGQVPCPVDTSKPVTESNYNVTLLAEAVPQSFEVELFQDDGITPLSLSPTAYGSVSEVNMLLEYSTNNLFN